MTPGKKNVPEPDTHDTDPNGVLRSRLGNVQIGTADPAAETPTPAHTQPTSRVREGMGTRPDPAGMRRRSLYVTAGASEALEQAADQVLSALGSDVPRHVALSALLQAGAAQAETVAAELTQQRAAELTARLQDLQGTTDSSESTPGV